MSSSAALQLSVLLAKRIQPPTTFGCGSIAHALSFERVGSVSVALAFELAKVLAAHARPRATRKGHERYTLNALYFCAFVGIARKYIVHHNHFSKWLNALRALF